MLSRITAHSDYLGDLRPGMLLMAYGQGIAFPVLQNAALYQVGPTDAGLGSGVQNTFLQLGGSLGLSVLVTLGLRHSAHALADGATRLAATDGYSLLLRIAALVMLVGAVIVTLLFERVPFVPPDAQALMAVEGVAGTAAQDHGTAGPPIAAPSSPRSARQAAARLISEPGAADYGLQGFDRRPAARRSSPHRGEQCGC
jgi:hypothetical protein